MLQWGSPILKNTHFLHVPFFYFMRKDLKGSCRNLYMRGPMVENVSQTMESDIANYLKR